jgi:UPF0716 family protein affecting phage T7 exclusion
MIHIPNPEFHCGKGFYTVTPLAATMAESNFPKKAIMALSILLIIGGVALYVGWGIAYGSWNFFAANFIPVYALVVPMILFGVLGILLTRQKD